MKHINVALFVPHAGCPHQCSFCNQKTISGSIKPLTPEDVTAACDIAKNGGVTRETSEIAFFGGSFTAVDRDYMVSLLEAAKPYIDGGYFGGIRISTRPDAIDDERLEILKNYHVTSIELGAQSMDDDVLKINRRGHTAKDVENASRLIKSYGFSLGLQMMTGLPGDTDEKSLYTADEIIELKPNIVRIYPTLTIKDTFLEKMYLTGKYKPQSVDEAVNLAKQLLLKFEKNNITVIRVGLQSTDEISENGSVVAGPVHSSFRELVESSIYYDIICGKLKDGCKRADVYVNPREVSKAVGNKRCNIIKLKQEKNIDVKICTDENLKKREVRCTCY